MSKESKTIYEEISLDEDGPLWKTVVDFTKINPRGVSADKVYKALTKLNKENR